MPYPTDLTTLAALKDYISPALGAVTASDNALSKIISGVSIGMARFLSRSLEFNVYSEVRNGQGRRSLRALHYPIVSVTNAQVRPTFGSPANTILPATPTQAGGLTNDSWFINLQPGWFGSSFPHGQQNITLNYSAGYITPGQIAVQTLPPWPGNNAQVTNGQQIQLNGYYFVCRKAGLTLAAGTPAWPLALNVGTSGFPGMVYGDPLQGVMNSINMSFATTIGTPNPAQSTQLFYNGLLLRYIDDFTITGNMVTLTFAPASTDSLDASYPTAGTNVGTPTPTVPPPNAVVSDGSAIWVVHGYVPVIPEGVSWLPEDIELCCLQQSALLFKNRTRVGDTGSGTGPDRINYFLKDAHPTTIAMLRVHRDMFPTDGLGVQ